MNIKQLSDKILLNDSKDVLRIHLYTKFLQHGIKPYQNHIDFIIEFYLFGGYNSKEEQDSFIQLCIEKRLRKSDQSARNLLSEYTELKVLNKKKNLSLSVSEDFLPIVDFDKLVLTHLISHSN
jgi:hypothetical protein